MPLSRDDSSIGISLEYSSLVSYGDGLASLSGDDEGGMISLYSETFDTLEEIPVHPCPSCPRVYRFRSSLNRHQMCHTGEKPHASTYKKGILLVMIAQLIFHWSTHR